MELSDKASDACAFGPFYPAILQPIVDHAERLWALVAVHELAPPSDEWATAWLVGRSEEIARVASEVLRSWHEEKTRDTEAAAELQAYLALVHGGLAKSLGCSAPACCQAPAEGTADGRSRAAVTIDVPLSDVLRLETTLRDPSILFEEASAGCVAQELTCGRKA